MKEPCKQNHCYWKVLYCHPSRQYLKAGPCHLPQIAELEQCRWRLQVRWKYFQVRLKTQGVLGVPYP